LDRFRIEKGLGRFVAEKENSLTVFDTLMLCKFSVDTWTDMYKELAHLYTLVTGLPLTAKELEIVGERIWNMEKVYNIHEGWTRKDDSLPPRVFKDPIPDGSAKGSHLTEEEFNFLLDDYYAARGWTKDGIPTKQKLIKLGLNNVLRR
jgi:aldehyde:ferredoxin oxidoreductase